jgi:hypothetical protein
MKNSLTLFLEMLFFVRASGAEKERAVQQFGFHMRSKNGAVPLQDKA